MKRSFRFLILSAVASMLGCESQNPPIMSSPQTSHPAEQKPSPIACCRRGDTSFLETVGGEGTIRLATPPQVADANARQRGALTGKVRSRAAKQAMAAGDKPAFLVKKEKRA